MSNVYPAGRGTHLCVDCLCTKKEKDSERCQKCHRAKVSKLGHRAKLAAWRKKGAAGKKIRCTECGADTPVPPRGPIECPRCKWVIE